MSQFRVGRDSRGNFQNWRFQHYWRNKKPQSELKFSTLTKFLKMNWHFQKLWIVNSGTLIRTEWIKSAKFPIKNEDDKLFSRKNGFWFVLFGCSIRCKQIKVLVNLLKKKDILTLGKCPKTTSSSIKGKKPDIFFTFL